MNKAYFRKFIMAMSVALSLSACDVGSPNVEVAAKVVDSFYQAQLKKDSDRALAEFSSRVDHSLWQAHLEHVTSSLGVLESYTLQHADVNTKNSGRIYIFDYKTTYRGGKQALETVTVFNQVDSEEISIVSHSISADDFEPLF